LPSDAPLAHQMQQGVLHGHVEGGLQFGNEIAARRTVDEGLGGIHQGSMTGEPNRIMGPQTMPVEARDAVEGIESAPMRIAGSIAQLLELSEHGERDLGAQSSLQIGKRGDALSSEQPQKGIGGEKGDSHNIIVPFMLDSNRPNYNKITQPLSKAFTRATQYQYLKGFKYSRVGQATPRSRSVMIKISFKLLFYFYGAASRRCLPNARILEPL